MGDEVPRTNCESLEGRDRIALQERQGTWKWLTVDAVEGSSNLTVLMSGYIRGNVVIQRELETLKLQRTKNNGSEVLGTCQVPSQRSDLVLLRGTPLFYQENLFSSTPIPFLILC